MFSYFYFFLVAVIFIALMVVCVVRCRLLAVRRAQQQRAQQEEAAANDGQYTGGIYAPQYPQGNSPFNNDGNHSYAGGGAVVGANYYGNSYTYNEAYGRYSGPAPPQAGTVLMVSDSNGANNGILGPEAMPLASFFPQAQVVEYQQQNAQPSDSSGRPNGQRRGSRTGSALPTLNDYYAQYGANVPPQLLPQSGAGNGTGGNSAAASSGGYGGGSSQDPYGCAMYLPRHPEGDEVRDGDGNAFAEGVFEPKSNKDKDGGAACGHEKRKSESSSSEDSDANPKK